MKVKELKALLAEADDDDEVCLEKEIAGYASPLVGSWEAIYVPIDDEVFMRRLTEKDRATGYTTEDLYQGDEGVTAIVLTSQ